MLVSKTRAAFEFTTEALWQKGYRVYFWTFTFYEVQADWEGSRLFSKFLNHLRKVFTDCKRGGVKVAELHKEHGIHFHALINRRLPVHIVRHIAKCYGIGRIFVCVAGARHSSYLAKYLTKQREGPLCESGRRMRRWACFGWVPHYCRVCDVENCGTYWTYRREHGLKWLGFRWETMLRGVFVMHGLDPFHRAWVAAS